MPYLGRGSDNGFSIRNRYIFTASANQQNFSGADANSNTLALEDGFLTDVFVNGIMLKPTTDYTLNNSTNTLSLVSAADANEEVTILVYQIFALSDAMPTSGGTFSGGITGTTANFSGNITGTLATASQTNITGVGALDAGSITSGFGAIDTGSSTITTTGAISGGTLTGSTSIKTPLIEFTDGDDALTIADGGHVTANANLTVSGAFTSQGIDDNADATAITITSAEAVGIGTSLTPNNYSGYQALTIGGSNATTGSSLDFEDSSGNIEAQISGTAGRLYLDADSGGATATSWIHLGVDGNQVMKLDHNRDAIITDGNLVIGTNGHGIDFSAQTHATSTSGAFTPSVNSEVLDHYEEGVWQFGFNTNMTVETNSNKGRYTRIGNVVTVNARMDIKTVTGSNVLFFNCLPFLVSAHTGTDTFENMYIGTLQTYNITNGGYNVMGKNTLTENNSHTVYAMYSVHNGNHAYLLNTMASTSSELMMTMTYRTG